MKPKCKNCYDKGFASVYEAGSYAMPDFYGDKKYRVQKVGIRIKYCTCLKGKRMKAYDKQIKKR